jgi:putative selenium metabolism hydrolase
VKPAELAGLARRIAAAADDLAADQQAFLADLIRIRSYTGQERPAVERTLAELRTIGCAEVWMDSAGNALGCIGGPDRRCSGGPTLLYDAHLDTNEVADESEWPHPPLEPVVEAGVMYGLGASDCKAGVAAIVYGAAILHHLGLTPPCRLVVMGATLEEDAEGFALRALVEGDGLRPDAVLIAEATDLSLRTGHRGRCEVRLRTRGQAAHASTPELGENAILKMLPVLQAVGRMELPEHPLFGRGTQVVTLIGGPHTPNSTPAWCEAALDRRLTPGETPESVLAGLRAVVEPLGASAEIPLQPARTHTGLALDAPAFFPGWLHCHPARAAADPLAAAGLETGRALFGAPPVVSVWKFSTDGAYSAGSAGLPTLGFGPQEERYVHTPLDQVNLLKLKQAAMFYALFPFVYCLPERGS